MGWMPRQPLATARTFASRIWGHVEKEPTSLIGAYASMLLCFLALAARPEAGVLAYPPLIAGAFGTAAFLEQYVSRRKAMAGATVARHG